MDEFELIRRYFKPLTTTSRGVRLGIGDDAALLKVPMGHELAVTTDTRVAGRHVAQHTPAQGAGRQTQAGQLPGLAPMVGAARGKAAAAGGTENGRRGWTYLPSNPACTLCRNRSGKSVGSCVPDEAPSFSASAAASVTISISYVRPS